MDEANVFPCPKPTSETDVLTFGWNILEEFADALNDVLSLKLFAPHDFYLIYGDEEIYRSVLKRLEIPVEEFF